MIVIIKQLYRDPDIDLGSYCNKQAKINSVKEKPPETK